MRLGEDFGEFPCVCVYSFPRQLQQSATCWGLKTAEIYLSQLLQVRDQGLWRTPPPPASSSPGDGRQPSASSACGCVTPISCHLLCLLFCLLRGHLPLDLGPTWQIQDEILNLITHVKAFFQMKSRSQFPGGQNLALSPWGSPFSPLRRVTPPSGPPGPSVPPGGAQCRVLGETCSPELEGGLQPHGLREE